MENYNNIKIKYELKSLLEKVPDNPNQPPRVGWMWTAELVDKLENNN